MKLAVSLSCRPGAFADTPVGRRNRRLAATGGAVLLHLVLLCAFLGSNPGGIIASASSGNLSAETVEPYIVLSLSGLRRPDASEAPASQAAQDAAAVQRMLANLRAASPDFVVASAPTPRQASLGDLFDAVQRERTAQGAQASGQSDRGGAGRGADDNAPDVKPQAKTGSRTAIDTGVKSTSGSGSLWGFLEPCWRKLPGRSTVPVSLVVALDARGMISTPPKIIRPTSASPDEGRLIAEARALAALSACLPYHGPDGAHGAPISVTFAATS